LGESRETGAREFYALRGNSGVGIVGGLALAQYGDQAIQNGDGYEEDADKGFVCVFHSRRAEVEEKGVLR
jgi:hypothetical protein